MPAATITAISRNRSAAAAPASPAASSNRRSAPGEIHLIEHGGAEQPIGAAQRLRQFEMAVMLANDQLGRFAGGLDRGGEVACLALKLWRLVGPVSDDQ